MAHWHSVTQLHQIHCSNNRLPYIRWLENHNKSFELRNWEYGLGLTFWPGNYIFNVPMDFDSRWNILCWLRDRHSAQKFDANLLRIMVWPGEPYRRSEGFLNGTFGPWAWWIRPLARWESWWDIAAVATPHPALLYRSMMDSRVYKGSILQANIG